MQTSETFSMIVNLACLFLFFIIIIYWMFLPFFTAPFFATSSKELVKLFDLMKLTSKDKFVDLGSGDGRVVLAASRVAKYAVGVEHNPLLTMFSRAMALVSTNGNVKFKHKDYWGENLAEYDVVFVYLMPKYNEKLKFKLEKELAPGARVVTNQFSIKGWKAKKVVDKKFYLYVIGDHK